MINQSESEPIRIATSFIGFSHQIAGGMPGTSRCRFEVGAAGGDVTHLAAGTHLFPVQVNGQLLLFYY